MMSHFVLGKLAKWALAILCIATISLEAEIDPKFYAVMVSASVQSSPAQITLLWSSDANATGYAIARKNGGSWSTVGNVDGSATSFTDSNVSNGAAYEYRITKSTSQSYKGTGYIYAGINAPLVDKRGKVVLLVENTYAADLASELRRLEWDLAADGWTVLRHDVARNDSVPSIKNIIKADYNADPSNVKAVFLFGRIPVPYSGNFTPDGHSDHHGAWAADLYYGDMDGNWTDSSVSTSSAFRPANRNVPGDGKFDQSSMPSDVEIAVGRVDFYNMTCYSNKAWSRSEKDLLRAYLNKDHDFRHRVFTVERRGVVCDNFGERNGEAFAASGWRNFGPFFGADNVSAVGYGQYFPTVSSQGYLWSYGTGGGSYYTCNGVGGSDDFANNEIKTVFTMFLGSYFGDWDNESNFLRAPLGSGYCLTTSWAGRPHWFYHHMGLGETIGHSTVLSQNNGYGGAYEGQNMGSRQVHAALLGDPTLRMHPVIPPSNVRANVNGSSIALTWNGSGDSDIVGYHVYRGGAPNSVFTRLTSSPISNTSFTDNSYSGGTYMVRTVKLERSGSGTYYNASQGILYPENGSGGGGGTIPQTPSAPANLTATASSASQINLSWSDNASNEGGYRVERKAGIAGSWSELASLAANATSYSNTGLVPATQYFFRVVAFNDYGASGPSNEAGATTAAPAAVAAAATFAGIDSTTQGGWQNAYGSDGYHVIANATSLPGYVTVSPSGKEDYQWGDADEDVRALERASGGGRVAGCWYSPEGFTVDLNFTDGNTHRLALYFLDWDRSGRVQKVDILDAATGSVLNTQVAAGFGEGAYYTWNVKGSIRVRLTKVLGPNALTMGLFFDAAGENTTTPSTRAGGLIGGKFQLQIDGEPGQQFEVYASEDLTTWTRISTVTLIAPTYDFLDSTSTGKTLRFYRAVALP